MSRDNSLLPDSRNPSTAAKINPSTYATSDNGRETLLTDDAGFQNSGMSPSGGGQRERRSSVTKQQLFAGSDDPGVGIDDMGNKDETIPTPNKMADGLAAED